MRKVEARMIQAIRQLANWPNFNGCILTCNNTQVWKEERIIKVILHNSTIAELYPDTNTMCLDSCEYQTNTTKSRLNALLSAFSTGSGIYQSKWEWYCDGQEWPGMKTFPIEFSADNYSLRMAEKLAG